MKHSVRRLLTPLFQPLTIRHVTFRNRFMSTSRLRAEENMPKERYQRYTEEKAKGGIADHVRRLFECRAGFALCLPTALRRRRRSYSLSAAVLGACSQTRCGHHVPDHAPWPTRRAIPGALAAHDRPLCHSRNVTSKNSERNGRSRYRPGGQGIRRRGATMQGRRLPSTTRCASAM